MGRDEMPVGVVVFLRYGLASAGFLVGNLFSGLPRVGKRDLLLVASVGALNSAAAPAMQIASLRYTQAIDVSILIALEPMLVVVVAALVLGEKPTRRTAMALGTGTIGMLILSGVGFKEASGDLGRRLTGNVIFASSLLAEVAVSVSGRRLAGHRPSHSIQLMMLAGFATASICFWGIFKRRRSRPSAQGPGIDLVSGTGSLDLRLHRLVSRDQSGSRKPSGAKPVSATTAGQRSWVYIAG